MSQECNHNVRSKTNVNQCQIQLNNNCGKIIEKARRAAYQTTQTSSDTQKGLQGDSDWHEKSNPSDRYKLILSLIFDVYQVNQLLNVSYHLP